MRSIEKIILDKLSFCIICWLTGVMFCVYFANRLGLLLSLINLNDPVAFSQYRLATDYSVKNSEVKSINSGDISNLA